MPHKTLKNFKMYPKIKQERGLHAEAHHTKKLTPTQLLQSLLKDTAYLQVRPKL